jgi:ankyrin repeat protein
MNSRRRVNSDVGRQNPMFYVRLTTLALIAFVSVSTRAYAIGQVPNPCTSLHECAEIGDVARLKQLLQQTPVDVLNDFKVTPLFTAAQYDQPDAARLLISAGANVNHTSNDGTTPLMMAVLGQDISLIKLLLDAGANANASDKDGVTVLMHGTLFVLKQTPEILRLLVSHGANVNAAAKDGRTGLMYAAGSTVVDNVKALLAQGANVNVKDNRGLTALDHAADIYETNPRTNAARKIVRQMRNVLIAAGAAH